MPSRYDSFTVRPADGGDLMTQPSRENPGLRNYTTKRDWRRSLDQEWQREGHVLFAPAEGDVAQQPFPNYPDVDEPITLTHQLRSPNGRTAFIAGTPTTLYRFFTEPGGVYADGVFEAGVYESVGQGEWLVIGSGFSSSGHRWEAENIAGVAFFNNGVDLVQTYKAGDFEVIPYYEMREQGIACVETIASYYGTLLCGDVTEINEDYIDDVLGGSDPYGQVTDSNLVERFTYRVIWSAIGAPTRMGSSGTCSTAAGSSVAYLAYAMRSFQPGDEVLIVGAGAAGTNLTAKVLWAADKALYLDTIAAVALTDAAIYKSDQLSLSAGYQDLQDDSSAVLRMKALSDRLVVMKDTSFFVASYTGDSAAPFTFTKTYSGPDTLYWRWTVSSINGEYLLFASRFGFKTFNLTTQRPDSHVKLALCENTFFDAAMEENEDLIFAAENGLTNEIWFCFPSVLGRDHALIYDYKTDTCSTSGRQYTAAATIKRPGRGAQLGPQQDWFVAGTSNGTVLQYNLTAFGQRGYALADDGYSSGYDCVLESGLGSLGKSAYKTMAESVDDFAEKDVRSYMPLLASHTNGKELTVEIESAPLPSAAPTTIISEVLGDLDSFPAVDLFARDVYFRDRLIANGGDGVRISGRTWEAAPLGSRTTTRD